MAITIKVTELEMIPVSRWRALKDYLGEQIDADDRVHRGFVTAGDLALAAPLGGLLAANRATLAKMRELEAGQ
jgi:hypothetical protein